jgi:hypothetical protein
MSPVRRGIRASDLRPLASAETLYRHFFVGWSRKRRNLWRVNSEFSGTDVTIFEKNVFAEKNGWKNGRFLLKVCIVCAKNWS